MVECSDNIPGVVGLPLVFLQKLLLGFDFRRLAGLNGGLITVVLGASGYGVGKHGKVIHSGLLLF